jgi:hypothetical protein
MTPAAAPHVGLGEKTTRLFLVEANDPTSFLGL